MQLSNEKLAMLQHNALMLQKALTVITALRRRNDIDKSKLEEAERMFYTAYNHLDLAIALGK